MEPFVPDPRHQEDLESSWSRSSRSTTRSSSIVLDPTATATDLTGGSQASLNSDSTSRQSQQLAAGTSRSAEAAQRAQNAAFLAHVSLPDSGSITVLAQQQSASTSTGTGTGAVRSQPPVFQYSSSGGSRILNGNVASGFSLPTVTVSSKRPATVNSAASSLGYQEQNHGNASHEEIPLQVIPQPICLENAVSGLTTTMMVDPASPATELPVAPTMTEFVARTTTSSSLTTLSGAFNTASFVQQQQTAPILRSIVSVSSEGAVRDDGTNSSYTITTVNTLTTTSLGGGGKSEAEMADHSHTEGSINSSNNQEDLDATVKAANEFIPPPAPPLSLPLPPASSPNKSKHNTASCSEGEEQLQKFEQMVLSKRGVARTQLPPERHKTDMMINDDESDGKIERADSNGNTNNFDPHRLLQSNNALPVVQELSILEELDALNRSASQEYPQTNSSVATSAAAQRRRAAFVRPGAYHQAPGQVAIRRARSSATSLHDTASDGASTGSMFSGSVRASTIEEIRDNNSIESAPSLWRNQSTMSNSSDEISCAFSTSSFSMQGYQEQQDHLPPDVMMMMDADVPPTPGTPGSSSLARRHTHSGGHSADMSRNEDNYEQELYDEESIGSFSISVATNRSRAGNQNRTNHSRDTLSSLPPLSTTAPMVAGGEDSTAMTPEDPANAGLVQAHPVQPQDTSNIVSADPVDAPEQSAPFEIEQEQAKLLLYKRPFVLVIAGCILLALGGIVAVVVIFMTGDRSGNQGEPPFSSKTVAPTTERGFLIQQKLAQELGDTGFFDDISAAAPIPPSFSSKFKNGDDAKRYHPAYSKALDWLVNTDMLQLNHTSANLLQRYLMAYFYYHTAEDGRWVSCNPSKGRETKYCSYHYVSPFGENYDESPFHIRWLSEEHECEWAGLYCDVSGTKIDELSLNGYNLSGTFPKLISKLDNLTTLSVRDNHFQGELPSELAALSTLELLRMNRNAFTGSVPPDWALLTSLATLDVGHNLLTGTIAHGLLSYSLTNLENLWIHDNHFSGSIPADVSSLTNMRQIFMSNNDFLGPLPDIALLTDLEYLDASGNIGISGTLPSEVGLLSHLRDLVLSSTSLEGTIPEELYALDQLQDLKLDWCNFTGTVSTEVGKLTGLQNLILAGNSFTGELPTQLGKLEVLINVQLQYNRFEGAVPESLCLLKGPNTLKELVVDCAPPSERGGNVVGGRDPLQQLECQGGCCTSCCDAETHICVPNH